MIITRLRDVRVRAVLALGAVLAVGVTGTYASWTDSVPVSGIGITSGTLNLTVDGADSQPNYTKLNMTNIVPGNSSAAVLTVKNAGTIPLTYYVDASTNDPGTGTLGSTLVAKITSDAATSGSGTAVTCAGSAIAGSKTSFSTGLLGSGTTPRSLAAGATEAVCVQATLPVNAPNSLQGQSTSITLTFNANQVMS